MELSVEAISARPVNEDSIPMHLKCGGCSQLAINCFQTLHGCRLCQRCVDSHRLCPCSRDHPESSDNLETPGCRATRFRCTPDRGTRREMGEIKVYCPNSESGCEKQLLWKQVDSHLANECEFQLVTCDLCSRRVVKLEMDRSHRNLQSPDCCSKLRMPCPVCCDSSGMLNRQEFVEHLSTCPERPVECKHRGFGCQTILIMSQLDEHYRSAADEHLQLVTMYFQNEIELKNFELQATQERLKSTEATVSVLLEKHELLAAEVAEIRQVQKSSVTEYQQEHTYALSSQKEQLNIQRKLQDQNLRTKLVSIESRTVSNSLEQYMIYDWGTSPSIP